MDANDVAQYLKHNPQFFDDHAELFAGISVPHPHADRAIPIAERQIITLRERITALEARMRELIRYGGENDTIGQKLHRSTLALFGATDLATTLGILYQTLHEDFGVRKVAARLWASEEPRREKPEYAPTSRELRDYANELGAPYCGEAAPYDAQSWFEPANGARSYAFVPLRTSHTFGLLGLASDDPQRFAAGIGTLYLTRLGELASVATARYLALAI